MRDGKIILGYIGTGKATNRYHAPFALALPEMFEIKTLAQLEVLEQSTEDLR